MGHIPQERVICPYSDKECPKLEQAKDEIMDVEARIRNMERILYLIVGILTVELGVTII